MKDRYDVLIVGGGAAGMAAAAKASGRGASVLLAEREHELGGVLNQCIHNGFGLSYFREDVTGTEYAERFRKLISGTDAEIQTDSDVTDIREDRTAVISGRNGVEKVSFGFCIMASGCRERSIGSVLTGGTRPAGVFTAGEAQKMVNLGHYDIGERFVILGSGNVGQIMARRLKLLGKDVAAVIEQNGAPGGLARNRRECLEAFDIPVILRSTVDMIYGSGRVSAVRVKHLDSGDTEIIPCDTLITAMGLVPDREHAEKLKTEEKYPEWLFFCGNCESVHDIVDAVTVQAERLASDICDIMEGRHNAECSDSR